MFVYTAAIPPLPPIKVNKMHHAEGKMHLNDEEIFLKTPI